MCHWHRQHDQTVSPKPYAAIICVPLAQAVCPGSEPKIHIINHSIQFMMWESLPVVKVASSALLIIQVASGLIDINPLLVAAWTMSLVLPMLMSCIALGIPPIAVMERFISLFTVCGNWYISLLLSLRCCPEGKENHRSGHCYPAEPELCCSQES